VVDMSETDSPVPVWDARLYSVGYVQGETVDGKGWDFRLY